MKRNILMYLVIVLSLSALQFSYVNDPIQEMKEVARQFVKVVDENDAVQLNKLLHPDLVQYVRLGEQLIPFKAPDFIQMVADKKLGGKPRTIEFHSAEMLRGEFGEIKMRAVSDEYDFVYLITIAKQEDKWMIINIIADILEV